MTHIFDSSYFIFESSPNNIYREFSQQYMLKKQKNIRFSGASASHQNGSAESAMKTVVTMASDLLMQSWMICQKDTLSIDFGQHKCTMMYGSKVGYLIYSMVYKPLGKFEPYTFQEPIFQKPGVKTLKWAPMSQIRVNMGFGKVIQHKLGWLWTWLMVQVHFSFILCWLYIILCCENHSPRYRNLDKTVTN